MLYTQNPSNSLLKNSHSFQHRRKTAQRLALHVLKMPREEVALFAKALVDVKDKVRYAPRVSILPKATPVPFARVKNVTAKSFCVVEEPNDVIAVEKTHEFNGLYHVLGGALSPLDGVGPGRFKIERIAEPPER